MEIKSKQSIWMNISSDYEIEAQPFESDLAGEILEIFRSVGIAEGSKLLEVGCGSGHLSVKLAEKGYITSLIDFDQKAIDVAKSVFKKAGVKGRFYHGDLFEIEKYVKDSYDVVWNSGVLEHFDFRTLISALQQMKGASKGNVFFIVPNSSSLVYLMYRIRMLREKRWNVGIEFLRDDYEQAISQSGMKILKSGFCGKSFTENSVSAVSKDAEVNELFKEIIEGSHLPSHTLVLQYFYCTDASATVAAGEYSPATERETFDRTFYLDALGTANSMLLAISNEKKNLQQERDEFFVSQTTLKQAVYEQRIKFEERVAALEKELNTLRLRYEQVLSSEAMSRQEIKDQQVKFGEEKNKFGEEKARIEEEKNSLQRASLLRETALLDLKSKFEVQRAELESELNSLKQSLKRSEAELGQQNTLLEEQQSLFIKEKDEFERKLTALQHDLEKSRAGEGMQKLALLEHRVKSEEQIAELKKHAEDLKNLLHGSRMNEKILSAQIALLRSEYDKAQTSIEALQNRGEILKELLEGSQNSEQILSSQLNSLRIEQNKARAVEAALRKIVNEQKNRIEEYQNVVASLGSEFRNTVQDIQKLFDNSTYRLFWFAGVIRHEVMGFKAAKILKFLRVFGSRLGGKIGALSVYQHLDPLWHILNNLRAKMTLYDKHFLPEVPSAKAETRVEGQNLVLPELRRSFIPKKHTGPVRVAYFTNQLLDWYDKRPRYGGGERYCLMLTDLLTELGFEVDLFQIGSTYFSGEYHGHNVKAFPGGEWFSEFNLGAAREFYEISKDYDHVIYNMPELSAGPMRIDAINICHGIWFDHNNYGSGVKFREPEWYRYLYRAFNNPRLTVSVDTNTINVIRTLWPAVSEKMRYIPNFVDPSLFSPPKGGRPAEPLVVLFPRRSQVNRGSRLLEDILRRIPHDVKFYWVGEGDDQDTRIIKDLSQRDRRLEFAASHFNDMPAWYRKAHICVIPTIACEGTSLSCIEALASGCATIATNVGGLSDLVQDEMNGLLVDPTPAAIADAINELIENPDLRSRLQEAGAESSKNFSIQRWQEHWLKVLHSLEWVDDSRIKKRGRPEAALPGKKPAAPRTVIVTRNAYHGGVERMAHMESIGLNAPVIVAGGINNPQKTCPFFYTYVRTYEELREKLKGYDSVLYHWPMDWAVAAIKDSGLPSLEMVHRTDTSECDKTAATAVVTITDYVMDHLKKQYNISPIYVNSVVDLNEFIPADRPGESVGALTSYYDTKGIDIFIKAWSRITKKYPGVPCKFFGSGEKQKEYEDQARSMGLKIEFNGPTLRPLEAYHELRLYVTASRIEGMPLAVLEALACNIPVVASDIEGHAVINRLAKSKGLPEPLILFRSEDPDDLARKIEEVLGGREVPRGRPIVEKLFSPAAHVRTLKAVLMDLSNKGSGRPEVSWELMDDSENTGTLASDEEDEGYFLRIAGLGDKYFGQDEAGNKLVTSYERFICYRYRPPSGVQRISCEASFYTADSGNIFFQFDWHDRNKNLVSMAGAGRMIDGSNQNIYMSQLLPEKLNVDPGFVNILFRPGQNFSAAVRNIRVRSWRKC